VYKLNKNLVINFYKNFFQIYNVENRKNILIDLKFSTLIPNLTKGIKANKYRSSNQKIFFSDCTSFTLWENMYQNSNFFKYKKPETKLIHEVIEFLIKNSFLKKNGSVKVENFSLDKFDGDLYQLINKHSILNRKKINNWWFNQKFKKNGSLKETPYKFIQNNFLKQYFRKNFKNKKILEVGCGSGYYTKAISKYAKKTVGIDNDQELLKKNKKNQKIDICFKNIDLNKKNFISKVKEKNFDYIIMIDFFLFLFNKKYQKNLFLNSKKILKSLKTLLTKNGKILILDPHFFWLTPFFGDSNSPYGIVDEYSKRNFGVIPSLEQTTKLFYDCDLVIEKITEPKPLIKKTNQNYRFFTQFPQWIFYELSKKK